MEQVCGVVARCAALGVELGIVVGGGNFWRGVKNGEGHMDRARADYMGMLATVMNSLALQDVLEQQGVRAGVMTAIEIQHIGETFSVDRANAWFREGRVIILCRRGRKPLFHHRYRDGAAGRLGGGGYHPPGKKRGRRVFRGSSAGSQRGALRLPDL